MPSDHRMCLDTILSQDSTRYASPEANPVPKSYPIRPSMHRSGTPRPDPWDLPYPAAMRTNSTYSTYSLYSNASVDSTSSMESNPTPSQLRIPALSRTESSDSAFGIPSPLTPDASPDLSPPTPSIAPTHRYDEIAAGMALTNMRSMAAVPKTPLSPALLARPEPPPRRSSSPRTPRDANGNRLYACPLASTYRCDQHFSTSGHARRHSRIHTGERAAECPECGQKFSRQDNMQQHRRTHRSGRDKRAKTRERCGVVPLSPLV